MVADKDVPSQEPLKSVFVIAPIGKLDETGFDFTKLFLEEIVKPAARQAGGFSVPVRADEVKAPGSITAKVVRDIVKADVCVADLTGRNPNVMYEVAIAHAADKPVILLQQESGGPPFDFTDERVIQYSTRADLANKARDTLVEHLKNAHHEDGDSQLRNTMHPVRVVFRELQTRATASEPEQVILDRLDGMAESMQILEARVMESVAVSDMRLRESVLERDRAMRRVPPTKLIASESALVERTEQLASRLLDPRTYGHLHGHLQSDHRDIEKIERLYRLLRALEPEGPGSRSKSDTPREVVELVLSLPPF